MPAPCVLVSDPSYRQWRPLIEAAALPVRYARVIDGQTIMLDGRQFSAPEVQAEVAWLTVEAIIGAMLPVFSQVIDQCAELRWAHSAGAGYDMPMMQRLLKRGVRLTISHVNAIPIAEYVVRSVLERFQRSDVFRAQRERREIARTDFREIYGSTWLIYGLGAIGTRVAERVRAFGARTIGVRRNPSGNEAVDELIRPAQLPEHLGQADVVLICAPLTAETQGLVDAAFLARMKPDALLVNVARAGLLDEAALVAALDAGRIDWAVLDVHSMEEAWVQHRIRIDDSPLWTHPKVELTPHIASGGIGRYERGARLFLDNLRRYLAGGPLPDEVTPGA